jgi:hypothetical protein
MIADAIKEQVRNSKSVSVDIATIRFTDKKLCQRFIYLTPPIAQQALVDFDQGKDLQPFGFDLRTAIQITPKLRKLHGAKGGRGYRRQEIVLASNEGSVEKPYQPAVVVGGHTPPKAPLMSAGAGVITARIRRFGAKNLKP